jgi:adenylate kinase family enzyme
MVTLEIKKIVIVGISGVGKSTLGRMLADKHNLPLYYMDSLIWQQNWVEQSKDIICKNLEDISNKDNWIVEGWIDDYSNNILLHSDAVIYLDYSGWRAMLGGIKRWFICKGKKRLEMPDGCLEGFNLDYLKKMFLRKERPHIEKILTRYPNLNIHRVFSPKDLDGILAKINL